MPRSHSTQASDNAVEGENRCNTEETQCSTDPNLHNDIVSNVIANNVIDKILQYGIYSLKSSFEQQTNPHHTNYTQQPTHAGKISYIKYLI